MKHLGDDFLYIRESFPSDEFISKCGDFNKMFYLARIGYLIAKIYPQLPLPKLIQRAANSGSIESISKQYLIASNCVVQTISACPKYKIIAFMLNSEN